MPAADIQVASWAAFKSVVSSKSLLMQYQEDTNYYNLFAIDYNIGYFYTILKTSPANSDQDDFETNFKATANQKIPLVFVTIPSAYTLKPTRTYKEANVSNVSNDQTLYTVTNGKTLYVTTICISGYNTSSSNAASIEIRDNATVKVPFSAPSAGIGIMPDSVPLNNFCITFPEPKRFSTNFKVAIVSGTVTYSCSFTGYEE